MFEQLTKEKEQKEKSSEKSEKIFEILKHLKEDFSDQPPKHFISEKEKTGIIDKIEMFRKKIKSKTASPEEEQIVQDYEENEKSKYNPEWINTAIQGLWNVYQEIPNSETEMRELKEIQKEVSELLKEYGRSSEYIEKIRPYIVRLNALLQECTD